VFRDKPVHRKVSRVDAGRQTPSDGTRSTTRSARSKSLARHGQPFTCRGLTEPFYPKAGNGRRPVGLEQMLRTYFLQQWFDLSDPGVEETLYDSHSMRRFVGIDLCRDKWNVSAIVIDYHLIPPGYRDGRQNDGSVERQRVKAR
jgi:hypothetical protein